MILNEYYSSYLSQLNRFLVISENSNTRYIVFFFDISDSEIQSQNEVLVKKKEIFQDRKFQSEIYEPQSHIEMITSFKRFQAYKFVFRESFYFSK